MTIAVIPAKSNSERLPNKNMQLLKGKPLIQYTIECAIQANIRKIIVSTDSPEIMDFSRKFGDVMIVERPQELCQRDIHCSEVVTHALDRVSVPNDEPLFMLLPTSPFRQPKHLHDALRLLNTTLSVTGVEQVGYTNNLRTYNRNTETLVQVYPRQDLHTQSQWAEPAYKVNGALYLTTVWNFLETDTFMSNPSKPLIMDRRSSINIDTLDDLLFAEKLL